MRSTPGAVAATSVNLRSSTPDAGGAATLAVLLGLAGALQLAAATVRWAPCVIDGPPAYSADGVQTDACAAAVDHLRDYALISAPFEPIPGAVALAGVASMVLVVFWAVTGWRFRTRRVLAAGSAIAAAGSFCIAVTQLLAAATEGELGVIESWAVLSVVSLVAALASVVTAVALAYRTRRSVEALGWALVAVAAVVSFPLVDYVMLNPFFGTHDSPIGSEVPGAIAVVAAAVGFAVAARGQRQSWSVRAGLLAALAAGAGLILVVLGSGYGVSWIEWDAANETNHYVERPGGFVVLVVTWMLAAVLGLAAVILAVLAVRARGREARGDGVAVGEH
ncbi:hypothetical protein [Herbiconiux liangxiaofengii]|uniref:hypothetical protein n=1 Tax=Herbiconiux liangxiaofengii TaxID=3342795 RepID=UPI0035B8C260